jgi:basic membrane protein A
MVRSSFLALGTAGVLASCAPHPHGSKLRIGLVTDLGGLGDQSYNDSAYRGLLETRDQLHVDVAVLQSRSAADFQPNLIYFASHGYDETFTVGYDQADDLLAVSALFPQRNFAIIDSVVNAPNVTSITFKSAEASFLAGALAALVTKTKVLGFLGGVDIPLIRSFAIGFAAGARQVDPSVRVVSKYVGSFVDVAAGNELTAVLFAQGVDIVFPAAGKAGLGAFQVVRARSGVYGIGVDGDQDGVVPGKILTSVLKRVDRSVFVLSERTVRGLPRQTHLALGLREDGVGLTDFRYTRAIVTPAIRARVGDLRRAVIDGRIVVPSS